MDPKVLIVGTVPYNPKATSRAFDAYFQGWRKENLAQIFSNEKKPCKGHCSTLFQITDYRMLQRWLGHKIETGKVFNYDELVDNSKDHVLEVENVAAAKACRMVRRKSSLTHLLRGILWRKRFWCTSKLLRWLDEFKPECVFLSFSNDYFILQIAYFVAQRFNIPIVSSISDDYIFNKHFSVSPFYLLYKTSYEALVRKVLAWPGGTIFISDKIRNKYNKEFGLHGETVYLTSTVQRKIFAPINTKAPLITYFGNIRMGRNHSLNKIGVALGKINSNYRLSVYSNESNVTYYRELLENPNIDYGGSIPYTEVQRLISESDITIIVEGFAAKEIEQSRYSLSTKAADALACGAAIFVFGSQECGVIEYMQSTKAATVCTDEKDLIPLLCELITNRALQKEQYERAVLISQSHHSIKSSTATVKNVVCKAIESYKKCDLQ